MEINNKISINEINKIFNNKDEKIYYIKKLYSIKRTPVPSLKTIKDINNEIITSWNYQISKNIIRDIFKKTEKYKIGKYSADAIKEMINTWNALELGELNWPFKAMAFDNYIQSINNRHITEEEKDDIVKNDIIKFRRIKRINTARNDFIEYLIVEHNDNIIPTLKHTRGVDFYINGIPYDQKVSRSVTKNFINDFGENWKKHALSHPEDVAKYLYKYQDEARFGVQSRLLIVYLDDDINEEDLFNCVKKSNLKIPYHITFDYLHSDNNKKTYEVDCFVILLHK